MTAARPAGFSVELSFGSPVAADLPLNRSELQKLFRYLADHLSRERRFLETTEVLGRKPAALHLHVCDDAEMRVIHRRFRNLDRTTDILSFPSRELQVPGPARHGLHLGDLVLSLPTVVRGAKRGRRTVRREFCDVLVHGFLHLLGHDHVRTRAEAREMFALQRELFTGVNRAIKSRDEPSRSLRTPAAKSARNRGQAARAKDRLDNLRRAL